MDLYPRKLIEKYTKWGHDNEGDFTLKIGPFYFTFYKWSSPLVRFRKVEFTPLNDVNSKDWWHKVKKED